MTRVVTILALLLVTSCLPYSGSVPSSDCTAVINGDKLFLGTTECMSKLPQQRMSGIWVVGHEYSIFYEGASQVPDISGNEMWLEADPVRILRQHGRTFDGRRKIYKIEFIGTKSERPGFYGHFGLAKRGALMVSAISIRDK